jgi:hypothetical protein
VLRQVVRYDRSLTGDTVFAKTGFEMIGLQGIASPGWYLNRGNDDRVKGNIANAFGDGGDVDGLFQ